MNNMPLYYGLVDAKIRAADKDLPVQYQKILIRKVNGSGNNFVKWVITTIKIRHLKKCFLTFWKNGMKLESVQIIWKILTDVYAGYIFISTAKSLIQLKFKNTFLWNHQKMVYVLTVMRLVLFLVSILIKKNLVLYRFKKEVLFSHLWLCRINWFFRVWCRLTFSSFFSMPFGYFGLY